MSVHHSKNITRGLPKGEPNAKTLTNGHALESRSMRELWEAYGLASNGNGDPFCNAANVRRVLAHSGDLFDIWYDSFRDAIMTMDNGASREWTDHDDGKFLVWLQENIGMAKVSMEPVRIGLTVYAVSNARDELTTWLSGLPWDGTDRIATFMQDAYGCPSDAYYAAVGRCWLISMAARALRPGCQVDTMTVLIGNQGLRKSSSIEALAGSEWYAAISQDFGGRDWLQSIDGKWLIEIPDLSGFTGRDLEHIKAIITTRSDRYCRRYSRRAGTYPRRSVLVATTNSRQFLGDMTGARRFIPADVSEINLDYIRGAREQLFAEAVHRFKAGESWWDFPEVETAAHQESRRTVHPFEETIETWLTNPENIHFHGEDRYVASRDLLTECLQIEAGRQSARDASLVTSIMHKLGWSRAGTDGRVSINGTQMRAFVQNKPSTGVLAVLELDDKSLI